VSFPFDYREELTATVESLTNLGVGVCRVDVSDRWARKTSPGGLLPTAPPAGGSSWVVFVPNTLPGETATFSVFRNHASYSSADLLSIADPSPDRVPAPCELFDRCGGCQYQHVRLPRQRDIKRGHVLELFERGAGLPKDFLEKITLRTRGTEHAYHYRSKITPHYDAPRANQTELSIGFQQKGSRRILDVPECLIATRAINERLGEARAELNARLRDGTLRDPRKKKQKGATLLLREASGGVVTDNSEYVTEDVGGFRFKFQAGNFFQNNPHVTPLMVDYVVGEASR
jgi:23S rRNA (uracil1939-C5)-methyltransferase/tRNA (uracil-5-)-methyltransferase